MHELMESRIRIGSCFLRDRRILSSYRLVGRRTEWFGSGFLRFVASLLCRLRGILAEVLRQQKLSGARILHKNCAFVVGFGILDVVSEPRSARAQLWG